MRQKLIAFLLLFLVFALSTSAQVNDTTYHTLSPALNNLLNKYNLKGTKFGLAVYSSNLNQWIYRNNATVPLVPASNTKLITTFTTLSLLGKDSTIKTQIATNGEIIAGTLKGDIYIIGGGDALLSIADLETIADEIRQLGIKKIEGSICGDDSFFDSNYDRFHYSGDRDEVEPTAPVSALSLEKNVVNIIVTSGKVAGKAVNVSFKPNSSGFKCVNNATVGGRKVKLSITSSISTNGEQIFYVRGNLPANRTYSYKHFIKNSALVVANALKDRLISGGVAVSGGAVKKNFQPVAAQNKTLYTHYNCITNILNIVNKRSDNYLAENLFKLNGALFYKRLNEIGEISNPNTAITSKNTAQLASMIELQTLINNDIDTENFAFNDGSGLSRRNFITAEGIAAMLQHASNKPFAETFFSSLSIAGTDGTLLKRMLNTDASGNVCAKTGSHRNVSALSGTIKTKSGDTLYFSFIFNGGSIGVYKEIENTLCATLAGC